MHMMRLAICQLVLVVGLCICSADIAYGEVQGSTVVFAREPAGSQGLVQVLAGTDPEEAQKYNAEAARRGFELAKSVVQFQVIYGDQAGQQHIAGRFAEPQFAGTPVDQSALVLDATVVEGEVFVLVRSHGTVGLHRFAQGKIAAFVPLPELRESDATARRFAAGQLLGDSVQTLMIRVCNTAKPDWPAVTLRAADLLAAQVEPKPAAQARDEWRSVRNAPATRPVAHDVAQEVRGLLEAGNYRDIADLPQKWRQSLTAQEQRELIAQLLPHLESRRSLPLAADPDLLILPSVTKRTEQDLVRKIHIHKDITVEGGRCAWAIEELLLYTMPHLPPEPVPATPRPAVRTDITAEGFWPDVATSLARGMPPAPPGWPASLSLQERLRLAGSPRIDPRVLRELIQDPDEQVRAAVAANPHTDFDTLYKLWHDADPKVSEAARANSAGARSVNLEEPPRWNGR